MECGCSVVQGHPGPVSDLEVSLNMRSSLTLRKNAGEMVRRLSTGCYLREPRFASQKPDDSLQPYEPKSQVTQCPLLASLDTVKKYAGKIPICVCVCVCVLNNSMLNTEIYKNMNIKIYLTYICKYIYAK